VKLYKSKKANITTTFLSIGMNKSQAAFWVGVLLSISGSVCFAEKQIEADANTANKKVIVFELDESFMLDIETAAFEQAIRNAAKRKPEFILVEIDTPGGRTDFAQRICAAITSTTSCPVVAFVKGGKYGGAISAGAAVAFACKPIIL
jgi:membrane-bound ClpP family serine protease